MFPFKRPEGELTADVARKLPWNKTNREIADQYGLKIRRVGYWRKKLGVRKVDAKRGPDGVDRTTWEWTLSNAELARRHGISRQRVFQLRERFSRGVKSPIVAGTALRIYQARFSKRNGSCV